ncbi:hypothetical protein J8L98_01350 [Pseudoalteromonas sp. MMG013]|nr:hypothetical protein [Pseudoalteromonas sp. MMG013]
MKMTNSIELLDWFKHIADIESDYMASKLLGISKQMVSAVRNGDRDFSEYYTLHILVVGEHPKPLKTMALLESYKAERHGDEKAAKIWREQAA